MSIIKRFPIVVIALGLASVCGLGWAAQGEFHGRSTTPPNRSESLTHASPIRSLPIPLPEHSIGAEQPSDKDPDSLLEHLKLAPIIRMALKPDQKDSPLKALQRERCRERGLYLAKVRMTMDAGRGTSSDLIESAKVHGQFCEQLLELLDKPAERIKCHELRLEYLKEIERTMSGRVAVGTEPSQSVNLARAARIDAEIELMKYKMELEKGKK